MGKLFDFRAAFINQLDITEDFPPVRITFPDLGILRTIAKYNQVNVGIYAAVEMGGIIRRRFSTI